MTSIKSWATQLMTSMVQKDVKAALRAGQKHHNKEVITCAARFAMRKGTKACEDAVIAALTASLEKREAL